MRAATFVLTVCAFVGCAAPLSRFEPDAALAKELHVRAVRAVLQPGAQACREFQVGISERDWVRAQVVEAKGTSAQLRIVDAGRFPHSLGGQVVASGKVVEDALEHWTPCS